MDSNITGTVADSWSSLADDHPGEKIPFIWAGPTQLAKDTLRPRLFIGLGHHPASEDGEQPHLELVLLFTGTNTIHPGEFIESWVRLTRRSLARHRCFG